MDDDRHVGAYSWHQSLDQATVNIFVPHDTILDDLEVVIDPPFLVARIRGQQPLLKGRIYEAIDKEQTHWNFEPTDVPRRRTASTASTMSKSSYAYVSDQEITSSFAASLDSAQVSDNDSDFASPERSHPVSRDEQRMNATVPAPPRHTYSYPASPQVASMESSLSSLDSLQPNYAAKLLTIVLVKERSTYWPRVIDGPIHESLSPAPPPGPYTFDFDLENKMYNLDPTSLGLLGEEYLKARSLKEEAFEYFVRSWHFLHTPFSAMRLVAHYLPATTVIPPSNLSRPKSSTSTFVPPRRGTVEYYVQCLGGQTGLAQLFLEAGLAHLDGIATKLLSTNYSPLNSLRQSELPPQSARSESSTLIWKRDRACARTYFERARKLAPNMDGTIPYLPEETDVRGYDRTERPGQTPGKAGTIPEGMQAPDLQMPSMYVEQGDTIRPVEKIEEQKPESTLRIRRRKQQPSDSLLDGAGNDDESTWYLYLPGIVGAGTALLIVSVVGAISFNSWRKNNN